LIREDGDQDFKVGNGEFKDDLAQAAQMVTAAFTSVMIFILYNRSNTAYDRWWEGGTLLQKTRGEWFNAYSSIMAFTSTKPEMQDQVDAYVHLLARLMSLLMCCGLQQVSPNRDRPFEIIDLGGIEPASMEFLNSVPDKVEIILQWIQRSMVLHVQTGVLPVAPPILSRAFQEVSRGIVNLQNARKIADFPYPYPLAQVSMILQLFHWALVPVGASLAVPRAWAVLFSFFSIFVLWCIHFNALDLEFPFGDRVNDLPMHEMQQDWNKSIYTLLDRRATRPPVFGYDAEVHEDLLMVMSDASDLYIPTAPVVDKGVAIIKLSTSNAAFRAKVALQKEAVKREHEASHQKDTARSEAKALSTDDISISKFGMPAAKHDPGTKDLNILPVDPNISNGTATRTTTARSVQPIGGGGSSAPFGGRTSISEKVPPSSKRGGGGREEPEGGAFTKQHSIGSAGRQTSNTAKTGTQRGDTEAVCLV
jgi:predicted membrane chloride channel (bestrophin family)